MKKKRKKTKKRGKVRKKQKKIEKKNKKREKLKKKEKKSGKESLWITVVIHSEMCVGEQWFPTPFRLCFNIYIYIYIYIYSIGLIKYSCYSDDSVDSSLIFSKPEYQNIKNFYFEYFLWKKYIFF